MEPLTSRPLPPTTRASQLATSALDRGLALVGLFLVLPVFVAIAVAVRATSPGPVFSHSVRMAPDGHLERRLRFRTAVPDDGVTPVGHVLRRYGLDALPLLLDVLRGDLSLIGRRLRPGSAAR
ncbi:sugar transferase [Trujillonella endophytica]|uniref:Sugar transferase n=1 Tax=Trujillonella endophytica TaxID=673521 RepID=A0A1H8W1E5_9ACTN|nr:sugar transferase [Trujillella endophytica]SEP21469.1 sugar transferase [Trujillella endophytica]